MIDTIILFGIEIFLLLILMKLGEIHKALKAINMKLREDERESE